MSVTKEEYFTTASIDRCAADMAAEISTVTRVRPLEFNPESTALLILDMQNFFLDPESHAFVPSAPAIIPQIAELLAHCRTLNIPAVFTRHSNTTENAGQMKSWWNDLLVPRSDAYRITDSLAIKNAPVIEKSQYDPFYSTNLESVLHTLQRTTLIICGVMTNLCCETAVRSAFVRGFQTIFPIDTTATYNYRFHQAAMLTLAHGFTTPIVSKDVIAGLQQAAELNNSPRRDDYEKH